MHLRPLLTLGALALGGCVNNYIVDDGGDSSGAALGEGTTGVGSDDRASGALDSSTASEDGSGGGTGGATDGGADGDGASVGSTGNSSDGGDAAEAGSGGPATGGLEACQPCTVSRQCGGEFDLCTMLGETSVCMNVCAEGPDGCPLDYSCMARTSVDRLMGSVCVPDSGACGS